MVKIAKHLKATQWLCKQYETIERLTKHHFKKHPNKIEQFKLMPFNKKHLICNFCDNKMAPESYLDHIESKCQIFDCDECNFRANKLINFLTHMKNEHQRPMDSIDDICLGIANERFFLKQNTFFTIVWY